MEYIKRKIIYFLAKHLLPITIDNELVAFDKQGGMYVGGEKMNNAEIDSYRGEVNFILQSKTWKLMNSYFDELTRKKMFIESQDITDLLFGKTVLYTLSIQKTMLENIKKSKNAS